MKFTPEVVAALAVLREHAENDFECHRLDVLERDLSAPLVVEIIDDTYQKFNGITYHKEKSGHFLYSNVIHRDVWRYYHGEIPEGYVIHHDNENKADNNIHNLQLLTKAEHRALHNHRNSKSSSEKICLICGKNFVPAKSSVKYCSCECYYKSAYTERIKKLCPVCGKIFLVEQKKSSAKYCSCQCAGKATAKLRRKKKSPQHRKTLPEKTCPICAKIFIPNNQKQTCCSKSCAAKMKHQKNFSNKQ